jgi:methionyl-tRNA formyltransferase
LIWAKVQDKGVPQDSKDVTRAPKITLNTAKINWSKQSAQEIDQLSRGISHQYPLWTILQGIPVQLFKPVPIRLDPSEPELEEPGTARLLRKQGQMIVVCAEGTAVQVERVKSQGKKEVGVNDWWNGLPKALRDGKSIKLG